MSMSGRCVPLKRVELLGSDRAVPCDHAESWNQEMCGGIAIRPVIVPATVLVALSSVALSSVALSSVALSSVALSSVALSHQRAE